MTHYSDQMVGQALTEMATNKTPLATDGHHPVVLAHENMRMRSMEEHAENPYSVREKVSLSRLSEFVAYVREFSIKDVTAMFCDFSERSFVAHIEYHKTSKDPSWNNHQVAYKMQYDTEFSHLLMASGDGMKQKKFVEFMADISDLIKSSTDVLGGKETPMSKIEFLSMLSGIKNSKSASLESHVGNDGHNTNATADVSETFKTADGSCLPERFTLAMPVFRGGEEYDVDFRIMFMAEDGQLLIKYKIIKAEKLVETAFDDETEDLKEQLSGKGVRFFM